MNTYQIVLLSVCAALILLYLYEKFTGHALYKKVKDNLPILEALRAMVKAVGGTYPSESFDCAAEVMDATVAAVRMAEDLWLAGDLPKEERPAYARNALARMLNAAGIQITQQVSDIIEGCIALACMLMPHGLTPKKKEAE